MVDININYRVISVNPDQHSIVVRYYTDIITEDYLAQERDDAGRVIRGEDGKPVRCITDYHISIYETPSPSEERLLEIIKQNAPSDFFKMQEDVLNANVDTSLSSAISLINSDGVLSKPLHPVMPFINFEDIPPEVLANTTLSS